MKNNLSIFNNLRPLTVGFDNVFDQLEYMMEDRFFEKGTVANFPPYNIVKTGENTYDVELALAGFNRKTSRSSTRKTTSQSSPRSRTKRLTQMVT